MVAAVGVVAGLVLVAGVGVGVVAVLVLAVDMLLLWVL